MKQKQSTLLASNKNWGVDMQQKLGGCYVVIIREMGVSVGSNKRLQLQGKKR